MALRGWLENPRGLLAVHLHVVGDISAGTDPRAIGCWLVESWGPGRSLVLELSALLAASRPASVRAQALRALGARGDPSVAAIVAALLGDRGLGGLAAVTLARLGPAADLHVAAVLAQRSSKSEPNVLWFMARTASRVPAGILVEIADRLGGDHHREALTALVQAGTRAEGVLLRTVEVGGPVAERAVAGLILLPGRTGPAFVALLRLARDPTLPPKTRALALRYVGESPSGVELLSELVRLASAPGDLVVRTAAARALGRLPAGQAASREAALAIVASDAPNRVRIAALRSAVQSDPTTGTRRLLEALRSGKDTPSAMRDEARSLIAFTEWRE